MIEDILAYNKKFIQEERYKKYLTSKYPDKKIVIVSCMDTRLTKLLPAAMGIKNGDVKVIKNAGGVISHPFGSAMRSILVAVYEFDVDSVYIVGHKHCGMANINSQAIVDKMINRGIEEKDLKMLEHSGINVTQWLHGFDDEQENVLNSVSLVKNHPLLPENVSVYGMIIDPTTGELEMVDA